MELEPEQNQVYFDQIDKLKPLLHEHKGLLWSQRYQSFDVLALVLSHHYWVSEVALFAWLCNQEHSLSQIQNIENIFTNYCTRVGPRIWSSNDEGQRKKLPHNQRSAGSVVELANTSL